MVSPIEFEMARLPRALHPRLRFKASQLRAGNRQRWLDLGWTGNIPDADFGGVRRYVSTSNASDEVKWIVSEYAVICLQSAASTNVPTSLKGLHFSESAELRSQPEHSTHQDRTVRFGEDCELLNAPP